MNINIPGVSFVTPAQHVKPAAKFAPSASKFAAEPEDNYRRDGPLSARRAHNDSPPNDFDEMPAVGAAAREHYLEAKGSGKKVSKVENVHHEAYDDRIGHDDHDDYSQYEQQEDYSAQSHLDRAIKPKSSVYEEPMGGIDDDPNAYRGGAQPVQAMELFPPGEHPLEGVPGLSTLPTPEALAKKSRYAYPCLAVRLVTLSMLLF